MWWWRWRWWWWLTIIRSFASCLPLYLLLPFDRCLLHSSFVLCFFQAERKRLQLNLFLLFSCDQVSSWICCLVVSREGVFHICLLFNSLHSVPLLQLALRDAGRCICSSSSESCCFFLAVASSAACFLRHFVLRFWNQTWCVWHESKMNYCKGVWMLSSPLLDFRTSLEHRLALLVLVLPGILSVQMSFPTHKSGGLKTWVSCVSFSHPCKHSFLLVLHVCVFVCPKTERQHLGRENSAIELIRWTAHHFVLWDWVSSQATLNHLMWNRKRKAREKRRDELFTKRDSYRRMDPNVADVRVFAVETKYYGRRVVTVDDGSSSCRSWSWTWREHWTVKMDDQKVQW